MIHSEEQWIYICDRLKQIEEDFQFINLNRENLQDMLGNSNVFMLENSISTIENVFKRIDPNGYQRYISKKKAEVNTETNEIEESMGELRADELVFLMKKEAKDKENTGGAVVSLLVKGSIRKSNASVICISGKYHYKIGMEKFSEKLFKKELANNYRM